MNSLLDLRQSEVLGRPKIDMPEIRYFVRSHDATIAGPSAAKAWLIAALSSLGLLVVIP